METQLELFNNIMLVPSNKEDYMNVYEFLCSLPIFLYGHDKPDLLEIERPFTYKGNTYKVKVKRTRLSKDDDSFLSGKEQDILDTILYLSTKEETEKVVVNGRVRVKLSIYKIYKTLGGKILCEDIKKGISKLKETQIEIRPVEIKKGLRVRWNCETLISQYLITDERFNPDSNEDDDKTFENNTHIEFNNLFSQELLLGRIKLINYPKYMSLKNPISKYIYKRLVLADMFSTTDYTRKYHNKSLLTFLGNGGFMSDTIQNKNNTIQAFKNSIKELKENNLIQDCQIFLDSEERKKYMKNHPVDYQGIDIDNIPEFNYKKGHQKTDFFFEIKPSEYLISENHKQKKIKRFKSDVKRDTGYELLNNEMMRRKGIK